MTIDDLKLAWRANNAITLEMLEACSDDVMELKPGKGKTIRSNFVHLIGVRRAWIETKLKKEAAAIAKLDWKSATRATLREGLIESGRLMEDLFAKMEETESTKKGGLVMFFAYCIAHEANHRGQVEIALRINGHEPSDAFLYGLWEWSKK